MFLPKPLFALALTLLSGSTCFVSAADSFPPLLDATLEDFASGLDSGLFSSVDLVEAYTAWIKEVNDTLHAVTELNPDAVSIATEADEQRVRGEALGPLHGIPILLKNNIATADKMGNTAGSYALLGSKAPEDSTVAAKLRKAGAVILGIARGARTAPSPALSVITGNI
ncbi:hypothetical protein IMZ48_00740 [Candidatus Bathyarchaeota archaeon]|nr:hypothetical protein [Candidatus Bathyarchaeota archaeon]